jgi:type VI secretion system protein VasD
MSFGMLAAIAACSSPPPPPPAPTVVAVKLTAAAGVNATQSGQGAPVVVRIYQLASPAAFEGAEFFRLYNLDTAALGADLVKKDEYLLAPGETRSVTLTPPEQVHTIGVFAAYRDFRTATWRVTAAVPAHQTTNLAVLAGPAGVSLATPAESRAGP